MKPPEVVTIDFETAAIAPRPAYPPKPVGVAIQEPGKQGQYLAWGHPSGNNCTCERATRLLQGLWRNAHNVPLLFHNAKFDLDVAATHLDLPVPAWGNYHDTLFLLFLHDPHAPSLSLKPSAERLLKVKPSEQADLATWILNHVPEAARAKTQWGAYISYAPGDVVAPYAKGDVSRTAKLFKYLHPKVYGDGMRDAYDRERNLLPILLHNEKQGIPINVRALARDVKFYEHWLELADDGIRVILNAPYLNIDSDAELATAIDYADMANTWKLTPTGKRSTSKKNLDLSDVNLTAALEYRSALSTCLSTFMRPWLITAQQSNGHIYTNWNQTRQSGETSKGGTRTGRLSSNPNFQNIPKLFKEIANLPDDVPPLPNMRQYIIPGMGNTILHRDYNQQELRILAHFEQGKLLEMYKQNPRTDIHEEVQKFINTTLNADYDRSVAKTFDFGMIYGMGIPSLAAAAKTEVEQARQIKQAHRKMLPDIAALENDLKHMGRTGEPIHTWGGRLYYCEPPAFSKKYNKEMTFEYKLLNYLIQGSAADCTKEAIIRFESLRKESAFMLTVHDENNARAPVKAAKQEMKLLREAMESIEFSLPMISDGKISNKSWGSLEKYKE